MESNIFVNRSDGVYFDKSICLTRRFRLNIIEVIIYLTVFSFVTFLTICGNLLVIISIIYFKQLHTPTNFLMLSLAVVDLFVGVILVMIGLTPTTRGSCLRLQFVIKMMTTCSLWHLLFISVDRYYAVCEPLRYRTKINARVIMILSFLTYALSFLSTLTVELQAVFAFYLPTTLMCMFYAKILMVAKRQVRSIQNTACQNTHSVSEMEKKATKTLAIVMGVYLMCWGPYFIFYVFEDMTDNAVPESIKALLAYTGFSNSLYNPFIYAFFYSWFRSAYRIILSGKIFQGDFTHSKLS